MKSISVTVVIFLLSNLSVAQTFLTGYVTLQNSGKQSAFPAQVKAFGATATDVATADGNFELVFDRMRPGHDAYLEITKAGYEVVNKADLAVRLPENDEHQRPLKIYLCPMGEWQRYADQYYEVNLSEINKTYQRKLAGIQKKYADATLQNFEHQQALAKLDEDRKAAEAQAQLLAEKFAKANLDDASERYKIAHRLFAEGKIDSVLIILNEEEMLADLEAAERDIKEGNEFVEAGVSKVKNGEQAFEKIMNVLERIRADSTGNELVFQGLDSAIDSVARYLIYSREFEAAELLVLKGLDITPEFVKHNTHLAIALLCQGRWPETKAIYEAWKDKPYDDSKTWKEVFLSDLDALEKNDIIHPDIERARALLKE